MADFEDFRTLVIKQLDGMDLASGATRSLFSE